VAVRLVAFLEPGAKRGWSFSCLDSFEQQPTPDLMQHISPFKARSFKSSLDAFWVRSVSDDPKTPPAGSMLTVRPFMEGNQTVDKFCCNIPDYPTTPQDYYSE